MSVMGVRGQIIAPVVPLVHNHMSVRQGQRGLNSGVISGWSDCGRFNWRPCGWEHTLMELKCACSSMLLDMWHGLTSFALASQKADRQCGAHEDGFIRMTWKESMIPGNLCVVSPYQIRFSQWRVRMQGHCTK